MTDTRKETLLFIDDAKEQTGMSLSKIATQSGFSSNLLTRFVNDDKQQTIRVDKMDRIAVLMGYSSYAEYIQTKGLACRTVDVCGCVPEAGICEEQAAQEEKIFIPAALGNYSAYKVRGEAMNKVAPKDSYIIVLIEPGKSPAYWDKELILCKKDNNLIFRRYRINPLRLVPESHDDSHETLFITHQTDITVIGSVCAVVSDISRNLFMS